MSEQVLQTSATIIPFPVGGRRSLAAKRDDVNAATEARSPAVSFGGAWYHDAAIEESKRVRER